MHLHTSTSVPNGPHDTLAMGASSVLRWSPEFAARPRREQPTTAVCFKPLPVVHCEVARAALSALLLAAPAVSCCHAALSVLAGRVQQTLVVIVSRSLLLRTHLAHTRQMWVSHARTCGGKGWRPHTSGLEGHRDEWCQRRARVARPASGTVTVSARSERVPTCGTHCASARTAFRAGQKVVHGEYLSPCTMSVRQSGVHERGRGVFQDTKLRRRDTFSEIYTSPGWTLPAPCRVRGSHMGKRKVPTHT